MLEWKAAREASRWLLPKHAAPAGWKHSALSHVEQEGVPPMPNDRGAGQGDVDGPLECNLSLEMFAAETRDSLAARQAAGLLPWIGVSDSTDLHTLQADHAARTQQTANLQIGGNQNNLGTDDKRHKLQRSGGVADLWYMDDADIMCHHEIQQERQALWMDTTKLGGNRLKGSSHNSQTTALRRQR